MQTSDGDGGTPLKETVTRLLSQVDWDSVGSESVYPMLHNLADRGLVMAGHGTREEALTIVFYLVAEAVGCLKVRSYGTSYSQEMARIIHLRHKDGTLGRLVAQAIERRTKEEVEEQS